MKEKLLVALACVISLFVAGCGDVPSEADYKEKLEKLVNSPGGHAIDIPKELDTYRAASDEEKKEMFNAVNR